MTKPSFYMVFVEGQKAPTRRHSTYGGAEAEAKRLCETLKLKAYVLEAKTSFQLPGKYIIEEYGSDLPF